MISFVTGREEEDAIPRPSATNFDPGRLNKVGADARNALKRAEMSTKEIMLEIAENLPADATLIDAICELEFRQAVLDGVASLDRGERSPAEEARQRIPQWIPSAPQSGCGGTGQSRRD